MKQLTMTQSQVNYKIDNGSYIILNQNVYLTLKKAIYNIKVKKTGALVEVTVNL